MIFVLCVWFVSLNMLFARLIHVAACIRTAFLSRLNNAPLCASVNDHWDCFFLLALVNNAAVNMGVHASVWVPAFDFFGYVSRLEFPDQIVILCLTFWGITKLFLSCTVVHSYQQRTAFLIFPYPHQHLLLSIIWLLTILDGCVKFF